MVRTYLTPGAAFRLAGGFLLAYSGGDAGLCALGTNRSPGEVEDEKD